MARITVEDCLQYVDNRFELVMLAAKRARQLMRGTADPTVPWDNDKATVVALREIATGHTGILSSVTGNFTAAFSLLIVLSFTSALAIIFFQHPD